ncbi:MAG: DUF4175 family protein [Caulobacterales bacterium]
MQHGDALSQLAREIARARQRLSAERVMALALPIILGIGLWAALWLTGAPERLPPLAQSVAVIGALLAGAFFIARAMKRFRPPAEGEARARLAIDSRLEPSAFDALDDLPAKLDSSAIALWRREQARARERAAKAKAGPYRFDFQRIDRFRLRYAAAIIFVGAAVIAGGQFPDRFVRAFIPDPGPLVGDKPMEIEAWLTPAAYTQAGPVALSDVIGQRVETPPSVEATVRVTGPVAPPVLIFSGSGGRREVRFAETADGAYEAKLAIPGRGTLKIVRFLTRATWRVAPAADAVPVAQFVEAPQPQENDHIAFSWRARDDFGVSAMALRVTPVNPSDGLKEAPPIDTPFESPTGDPREAEAQATLDLTKHPYAGLEVEARIVAFDALGQAGASAPIRFTLPEKVFLQPLARAAIEIRRQVMWERRPYRAARRFLGTPAFFDDFEPLFGARKLLLETDDQDPRLERAPQGIQRAVRWLDALTMQPGDGYFRDRAVFLGFRLARGELNMARDIAGTDRAAETLWRTAIRAEYGSSADARRALEAAQQALNDALASGASPERLQQLMNALRQATENYMQALVQEAMRDGQTQESQEDTEEQASISQRDINEMMEEAQRLMQEGRNAEAQALLQQLAGLLNNMEVRLSQGGEQQDGEGGQQQDNPLSQSMDQLSQAMGEQRALNDDTRERQENAEGGGDAEEGPQGGAGGNLAQRQAEIRRGLGEARRQAGEQGAQSQALNSAEGAMQRAENALRQGNYEEARAAQDEAMGAMRRGANELAAEMRRKGEGGEQGADGERDPLGRQTSGEGASDGDTTVPQQSDRVRAREILDDIRRRAQDANRPEAEREYLRRLLERFSGDS